MYRSLDRCGRFSEMSELNETAHKLLDSAERYTKSQGFNAFNYQDLQNEVGVKASSIHSHFPTKKDLALTLTARYTEAVQRLLGCHRE